VRSVLLRGGRGAAPFLLLALVLLCAGLPGAVEAGVRVLSPRTLVRTLDPVVIQGSEFPEAEGLAFDGFRLFAEQGGELVPIRFDLNEKDEDDLYVLDQGPDGRQGTGRFGPRSELAFMARDAGGRVDARAALPGAAKVFTIQLQDPRDALIAWAYLAWYEHDAPPPAVQDRVRLTVSPLPDPLTGKAYTEIAGETYRMRSVEKSTLWYDLRGPDDTMPPYSDHVTVSFSARFYPFIPFHKDEWSLRADTRAWTDGRVRTIRRVRITVELRVGRLRIARVPARIVYDVVAYDRLVIVPVKIWSPFALRYLTMKAAIGYGLDLSPATKGLYRWYSNVNPEGFDIDGRSEGAEKKIEGERFRMPSRAYWSAQVGPYGTVVRRQIIPARYEDMGIQFYLSYTDDEEKRQGKEFFPGRVGYFENLVDVHAAGRGVFTATSYWFFPRSFRYPDDLPDLLAVLDRPIAVRVDGRQAVPGLREREE